MPRTRSLVAAFLPISFVVWGCAGSVEDAWAGEYAVSIEEDHFLCDEPGGDPTFADSDVRWNLAVDEAGLHVAGRCRMPINATSETRATFGPVSCETILSNGAHARINILGGALMRDGREIFGDQTFQALFDDESCINGRARWSGVRVD